MKLSHAHLKVIDLVRAKNFYSELLGLKVIEEIEEHFVFMSFGNAHHDLALQKVTSLSSQGSLYHLAFEVDSALELLNLTKKLTKMHIAMALIDHGISWAIYSKDPEGNGIEIFLDRRKHGITEWKGISRELTINEITKESLNS